MFSSTTALTAVTFAAVAYAQTSIPIDPAGQGLKVTQPSGSAWWGMYIHYNVLTPGSSALQYKAVKTP
jgi:hypothetical protein